MFCLDPLRIIWLIWNDLWKPEWVSVWPSSRAQTWSSWWPAEGRVWVTLFRAFWRIGFCQIEITFVAIVTPLPCGRATDWLWLWSPRYEKHIKPSFQNKRRLCNSTVKKNPQVYKSSSHSGNPYHLSLRLVNFISSALPGCLNSTSDISSTVKSYNLQQDGTSDWGFQNKTLLAHNISLSNPFLKLKWAFNRIKYLLCVSFNVCIIYRISEILIRFWEISVYSYCIKYTENTNFDFRHLYWRGSEIFFFGTYFFAHTSFLW